MISDFVKVLKGIGMDPMAEDVADILWLSKYLDRHETSDESPETRVIGETGLKDEENSDLSDIPVDAIQMKIPDGAQTDPSYSPVESVTKGTEERAEILPLLPDTEPKKGFVHGSEGLPIRIPGASALPGKLSIGRSLRPLMRKKPSRKNFIIDEDATVRQIADSGIWIPALCPKPSRWFDVVLVTDDSPSMIVWKDTIAEFKDLLERQGAFRNVQMWRFHYDHSKIRFQTGVSSAHRDARELIDPSNRRIILVVSDCVSQYWHDGSVFKLIRVWAEKNRTAIVQMFPYYLWNRTGLKKHDQVWLRNKNADMSACQLEIDHDPAGFEEKISDGLRLPVVTLDSRSLLPWAKSLIGMGGMRIPGVVFRDTSGHESEIEDETAEDAKSFSEMDPEQQLRFFQATSSPEAQQLANYLAAVPLTLPIIRQVQRVMLPESRPDHQVQLAEIFLSGLLQRRKSTGTLKNSVPVCYDFVKDVRKLLLSNNYLDETMKAINTVSTYLGAFIDKNTGNPIDFQAIVADPSKIDRTAFEKNEPFASVSIEVLKTLGGKYKELSKKIEKHLPEKENIRLQNITVQKKQNTITWLHLSDLHYCEPRDGWDAEAVLGALAEDLERMEDRHGLLPDLVFFTGDIAFGCIKKEKGWNLADQYAGAASFLDGIRRAFSIEIPKTNLFLVPGNHDVNRKSVNPSQTAYLDGIDKENEITEMIKAGELPWQDNFRRLSEYKAFLETHGYAHLLEDPDRLVYAIERKIGDKTIGIGGFNSAWSCGRNSADERGRLWMAADWQSRTILSAIKNADVKIAMAHHPGDWFKSSEKQYFQRVQESFHFFLHGHEHDDWVTPVSNYHATVSAGACYERSGKREGYNFVRLDFDENVVEIWPRAYSGKSAGGWTRAQLPGKLDDDGPWRIREFQWTKSKRLGLDSKLRQSYLRHVMEDAGFLTLAGIDNRSAAGNDMMRVDLDSLYTALLTHTAEAEERWLEKRVRPEEEKRLSALDMLNRHDRLVLLGEPGSGKSTFVNFVAWCLAGENLGNPLANLNLLRQPLPTEKKDQENPPRLWDHPPLIPVRVILRDVVASGVLDDAQKNREDSALWRFIESALKQKGIGEYALALRAELMDTGGMILLDGLDEVPAAGLRREMVKHAVETFASAFHRCRYLVTSRTYAYQKQNWQLNRFDVTVLSPFNLGQIRHFVDLWYRRVAPKKGMGADAASARAELLKWEIEKNKWLRDLAERPLLLTLMACLHAFYSGKLPEKRVELYDDTVKLLLEWWDRAKWEKDEDGKKVLAEPSISEYLDFGIDTILRLLKRLAFDAHKNQPDLVGVADISKSELLTGLLELSDSERVKPNQLLKYLRERAGILVPRGVNVFTFPHRTFQEYLAACYQTDADYPYDIVKLFRNDPERWREVLLLAGAKSASGGQHAVWSLANELCPDTCGPDSEHADLWGALLAGQALMESADLTHVQRGNQRTRECVRNSLVCVLEGDGLPALERAGAGVALAKIGDPRKSVMTIDAMEFCLVPPGTFFMSEKDEEKICAVLDSPYWLGRFPVTNAQFDFFVQAGGYANKDYWDEAVREGVWKDGRVKGWVDNDYRDKPYDWGNPYTLPNHPVVGVMWYEAMAFTRWLTKEWHEKHILPTDLIVVLPSEAEWEKSARGGIYIPEIAVVRPVSDIPAKLPDTKSKENPNKTRRYPYGNEPDPERMNFDKTAINTTSAVGCFSTGQSPFGCEEMCGNTFEWTRSINKRYPYKPGDGREDMTKVTNSALMILRGGYFGWDDANTRCGFRGGGYPNLQFGSSGFRLLLRSQFSSPSGL